MLTPDTDGKKVPQFSSFKLAPAPRKVDDCCCEGACATEALVPDTTEGTRYTWKVAGMDCAACARKVENAVRQVGGVNQVQVLFATEKLVVDANADIRQHVERAVQKAGYTLRDEQATAEARESRLQENLPLITLIIMMAISWGLEQFNHPFGQLAFIATTLVGLYPIARQALRLMKTGSWFAIETLMSVAAIGALFIGATAEAAMVLLLFLIGERLEGWAASRARKGVSALMALKPETATRAKRWRSTPCNPATLSKWRQAGAYPPTAGWSPVSPVLMRARSPASRFRSSAQRARKSPPAPPAWIGSLRWRCCQNRAPARLTVS